MTKPPMIGSAAILFVVACSVAASPDPRGSESDYRDMFPTSVLADLNLEHALPQERGRRQGRGRRGRGRGGPRVSATYQENCASCHGDNAQGSASAQSLVSHELFSQDHDRRFYDAIRDGSTAHEFGAGLNDEQVWALVVRIRELQARQLREQDGSPTPVDGVYTSQHHKFRVEDVVTEGLNIPWSVEFLPDGQMLVTNRPGGMYVYRNGTKVAEVQGLPASIQQGQGGLMDVRVHPTSDWIYLSVADPVKEGQGEGAMTKVYRGKLTFSDGGVQWTNQETIWETDQEYYNRRGQHFGCKFAFDGEGHVFFSVGERGTNMRVQEEGTPYGKVMRTNLDGSIPDDNPIPGSAEWSTGHRNQQGLAFDLEGNLWDTEHGPRGGDEVNLIVKGANYGWPIKAFSINYSDTPFRMPWNKPDEDYDFTLPAFRWLPSIGASGLDLANGPAFPEWRGDLLAGGLAGKNLDRFRMEDGKMVEREELLHDLGRVRDIRVHRDGTVYVALNQPDKIIRLVPAN